MKVYSCNSLLSQMTHAHVFGSFPYIYAKCRPFVSLLHHRTGMHADHLVQPRLHGDCSHCFLRVIQEANKAEGKAT